MNVRHLRYLIVALLGCGLLFLSDDVNATGRRSEQSKSPRIVYARVEEQCYSNGTVSVYFYYNVRFGQRDGNSFRIAWGDSKFDEGRFVPQHIEFPISRYRPTHDYGHVRDWGGKTVTIRLEVFDKNGGDRDSITVTLPTRCPSVSQN